ncbi:MAG: hypothetical protein JNK26_05095 [Candidatus Doudnabacteria bacterium]|nr:hypothetical protein [Candidatus Doudnabacteria bacterium]
MLETHPLGNFTPPNMRYLLLGSFAAKGMDTDPKYDWYYSSRFNQFWRIIEKVYSVQLLTKKSKIELFSKLEIGIADIIYQCERVKNNSLDTNLTNIVWNESLNELLRSNKITRIYFTSKFVEQKYRRHFKHLITEFPHIELVTLPSPSPRYASMSLQDKTAKYKELLPEIK